MKIKKIIAISLSLVAASAAFAADFVQMSKEQKDVREMLLRMLTPGGFPCSSVNVFGSDDAVSFSSAICEVGRKVGLKDDLDVQHQCENYLYVDRTLFGCLKYNFDAWVRIMSVLKETYPTEWNSADQAFVDEVARVLNSRKTEILAKINAEGSACDKYLDLNILPYSMYCKDSCRGFENRMFGQSLFTQKSDLFGNDDKDHAHSSRFYRAIATLDSMPYSTSEVVPTDFLLIMDAYVDFVRTIANAEYDLATQCIEYYRDNREIANLNKQEKTDL